MSERPPLPPLSERDPGDMWVEGPDGTRYWGRFGAAGLLCWHRTDGILLQHRVQWSHFGGTWGLPGGARKLGEDAVTAAIREAAEEATVPPEVLRVIGESVLDLGFWTYTTVIAEATAAFEPVIGDPESAGLAWVPVHEVEQKDLHPGFARAWPALRNLLPTTPPVVE